MATKTKATRERRPIAGIMDLTLKIGRGPEQRSGTWKRLKDPAAPPALELGLGPVYDEADALWFLERTSVQAAAALAAGEYVYQPAPSGYVGNKEAGELSGRSTSRLYERLGDAGELAAYGIQHVDLAAGRAFFPAEAVQAMLTQYRPPGNPRNRG